MYDKDYETGDWENYVSDKYIYEYDAYGNEISELLEDIAIVPCLVIHISDYHFIMMMIF